MGSLHPLGNLAADLQGLVYWQSAFGNTLLQCLSWDQFQHKEMDGICVLKAIDGGYVGVIQ